MKELWKEIKHVDTSTRALRSFGLMVGGVLIGLAAVLWGYGGWTVGTTEMGLMTIGGALVVLGGLIPSVLMPVYRVWMALAFILGFIMTRLLLAVVFYGLVTPIGVLRRHVAEDPMQRDLDPETSSYWIPKARHPDRSAKLEKYY